MSSIEIRILNKSDYPSVKHIYQLGMDTSNAIFETSAPDWESWNAKFSKVIRLVAEIDGVIVGWAAVSPISTRSVYSGVPETCIYKDPQFNGIGVGKNL